MSKHVELFKIFSRPLPQGTRMYTISMDINAGTLVLVNSKSEVVEETPVGLLWCQSLEAIGEVVVRWFGLGCPVETSWAYPATNRGGEALGYFVQGCARMAQRLS